MSAKLRLKFDANQAHQVQAVDATTRLFESMLRHEVGFELGDEIVPNLPSFVDLDGSLIEENLRQVQESQGLQVTPQLEWDSGPGLQGLADENHAYPHFTVEMETGTGKTYVYLRTMHELRQRFGWSKFVIVVPSVAIFEGVFKSHEITEDHFRLLFGNQKLFLLPYEGTWLSRVKDFATTTHLCALLMTIAAFKSRANVIYKPSEKLPGERIPYQFIQETRPILILDEPQNMESPKSREALRTLKPLFALRYSATHRSSPNPIYRLSPIDAYQRKLVKRIQVYGITERDSANVEFLTLCSITPPPRINATVHTRVHDLKGTREADVTLHQGDDLFAKTGLPEHKAGFLVENIDAGRGFVEFVNGERLYLFEGTGATREVVFREQIRQTIRQHMRKQVEVLPLRLKVLSLFFVDHVASYRGPEGIVRRLFDEEFERAKRDFAPFAHRTTDEVRSAYFAQKQMKDGSVVEIDTEGRDNAAEREAEKSAFQLIMRDKERLLSLDEPVSFIFAHSALKEGWDNPNVFQICTLRNVGTERERRQQIGRGMRLPVDQSGERLQDEVVNVLTVVANESFSAFANGLQREYVEAGDAPPPLPTDAKRRRQAKRNDRIYLDDPDFQRFWSQLNRVVRYRIRVVTPELVDVCVNRLNDSPFPVRTLAVEKGRINLGAYKVHVDRVESGKAQLTFTLFDEHGEPEMRQKHLRPGEDIADALHEDRLRPLGPIGLERTGDSYEVVFTSLARRVSEGEDFEFTPAGFGATAQKQIVQVEARRHPVFNLIDRAAKETGITRPTVNAIFKGMRNDKKRLIFENPEGFATVFIGELRNALADHVTERIEFVLGDGDGRFDRDELFPPVCEHPQRELIEAGERGLYDWVQKDSDVEQRYVDVIRSEGASIVFYFKFPPKFKIDLPRMIGDYNPDWGIARIHRNGDMEVRTFVHETKGTTQIGKLRFPHEQRKVRCAEKYFATIGVTYQTIDPSHVGAWWTTPAERGVQTTFQE